MVVARKLRRSGPNEAEPGRAIEAGRERKRSDVGAKPSELPAESQAPSLHSRRSQPCFKQSSTIAPTMERRQTDPPPTARGSNAHSMAQLQGDFAEFKESVQTVQGELYHILTSKRVRRAAIGIILLLGFAAWSYLLSIGAYFVFYRVHLPDQISTVPVYLQYGYGPNPFSVASLAGKSLKNSQPYDISLSLTLPRSPANLERGNFMVALHLLDGPLAPGGKPALPYDGGSGDRLRTSYSSDAKSALVQPDLRSYIADKRVLYSATRPALVPYTSPLVALVSRWILMPYYLLFPHAEMTTVVVTMAERVVFGRGATLPRSMLVEVQAGQGLQVYEAKVTLTAQLEGLRWFMHHYRVLSFAIFSGIFWAIIMVVTLAVFTMPLYMIFNKVVGTGGDRGSDVGRDDDDGVVVKTKEREMSDTERTFPSSSKQPALKYETPAKEDRRLLLSVLPAVNVGAEADDEDDGELDSNRPGAEFRDSGIGTSYSDSRSQSKDGARKRAARRGD
ncbi:putative adipose-regulatory protein-domain-containing protein [Lasiosphaeris hirsuta]|uniref:Adipose-regulatory protein-domain-containing protein n=1 Tax=Lasiosphaeris hirsuta TaxID=260670 RepID=A0AA40DLE1_9PEZI|nr:putative adipose-regulatory protein-domain-containing protein [Lasiosphaeris hirsuta]